jgi:hypothetical protein
MSPGAADGVFFACCRCTDRVKRFLAPADSSAGDAVNCLTASELSLLENLEQRLKADVSVSLLAELERELLRLRSELSVREWEIFCSEFHHLGVFDVLRPGESRVALPANVLDTIMLDTIMADTFQARPSLAHSAAHLIRAWEYSLPVSRSVRARKSYLSREIAEVIKRGVKPRILILGAGQMREADDAVHGARLQHAEFVALEPDAGVREQLRRRYARQPLEVEAGGWNELGCLANKLGLFDLIYSGSWLDATDEGQALSWLGAAVEMLRPGGRIFAPNFTAGSRDAGWIEACWNWHPHYRTEEELAHLVMNLRHPETRAMVRGHAVFRDESGASAYLEIYSI